jgi:hypothetical protein
MYRNEHAARRYSSDSFPSYPHSCTKLSHFWAGLGTEPNVTSCWLPSQLLDSRLMQVSRLFDFAMPSPFLNTQGIPRGGSSGLRLCSASAIVWMVLVVVSLLSEAK